MKNTISFILIIAILLSLAACQGAAPVSPSNSVNGGASASGNAAEGGTSVEDKYAEPMTIQFATVQVREGVDYNSDDLSKFFCEKYNIQWDIVTLTWENWAEKLRIWINSNDMPDMATWDYIHGEALSYAEQELVRRFPDDWKTRWPNVNAAYESTQIGPEVEQILGGTYYLSKPIFSANTPCDPLVTHTSIYMRKDWLTAVGAEIKDGYTLSEILDISRKIKEKDPGGLGAKLLPINARVEYAAHIFVTSNNAYSRRSNQFYKGEDNQYHWGPASPDTLTGLKFYQQAYREGLLNPEFFTVKEMDDYNSFCTTGQTGIIFQAGMCDRFLTTELEFRKNLGLEADDVMHVAYVLGEDGKYHNEQEINFWTTSIFSPKMEDAKFERIMDMMDFAATDEGQMLIRLGFKDKDYSVESDGSYKTLWDEGLGIIDIYPSADSVVYGNLVILSDDFMLVNPAYPQKLRDRSLALYKSKSANSDSSSVPPRDWMVYFQDSPSRRKVNFELDKEYAQLITMDGDIEQNWKKWVTDKSSLIDPVLKELNALA